MEFRRVLFRSAISLMLYWHGSLLTITMTSRYAIVVEMVKNGMGNPDFIIVMMTLLAMMGHTLTMEGYLNVIKYNTVISDAARVRIRCIKLLSWEVKHVFGFFNYSHIA